MLSGLHFCYFFPSDPARTAQINSNLIAKEPRADLTPYPQSAGRTIKRHERQEILDSVRSRAQSRWAKRDIKVRQHFMERSFAQGTRYGLKRARWRGRWRVQIQDYLIAIVQNIELLIDHARPKPRAVMATATNAAMVFTAHHPMALQ